ncbi:MAG TPA: hypothetical protein VIF82_05435 [Burkholderiaceae bacterium]
MNTASMLLKTFIGFIIFSYAFFGKPKVENNNWFKLGLALYAFSSAVSTIFVFESLQSASSLQLFVFIGGLLESIGSAMLVVSLKPGQWKVVGLLPAWEPDAMKSQSHTAPQTNERSSDA